VPSQSILITVRLFASAKEVAKLSETKVELPIASRAGVVLDHLSDSYPAMTKLRPFIRLAVNEAYVDSDFTLHDGDEVAVLPPVSGG